MTPSSHAVRGALNSTLDAQAAGFLEARLLFNPDAEINSLAELIARLRDYNVPQAHLRAIFTALREAIELNARQLGHEGDASGRLDELAAVLHRAECEQRVTRALGIKAIAKALRAPLSVVSAPVTHPAKAFVASIRTIDDVITQVPESVLRSPTLRHELGRGPHNALLTILDTPHGLAA